MSKKKLKVGIVGCGAIGTSLSLALKKDYGDAVTLVALCDKNDARTAALQKKCGSARVSSLERLIRLSDLVVEAASASAVFDIASKALAGKKDVLIMSVGGVLGREKKLFGLAKKNGCRIYFPSGAICGIDGIKALALLKIDSITLKTFKPPGALEGAVYLREKGISLSGLCKPRVIFDGPAGEAVKAFPQNINVVALLRLAAGGQVEPRVQIVAVPGAGRNIHEIEVVSPAARITLRCENTPSPDNPKTSLLAILSALKTIAGMTDVVRIGG
jgi:aspartate dehydrogenase